MNFDDYIKYLWLILSVFHCLLGTYYAIMNDIGLSLGMYTVALVFICGYSVEH